MMAAFLGYCRFLKVVCFFFVVFILSLSIAYAEHRDIAPIPADVVQQLTKGRNQPDNPLAIALARHLDEAESLINDIEDTDSKGGSETVIASKRMLMEGKLNELATMREEVRRYFAETRARLVSLGLEDKANELDGLLAKVEKTRM
ncbi:MAG: hypothetical protein OEV28_02975 [Nitrospirota bacterium]|nr:hypothetical protein [Nitrospirota bacterium]